MVNVNTSVFTGVLQEIGAFIKKFKIILIKKFTISVKFRLQRLFLKFSFVYNQMTSCKRSQKIFVQEFTNVQKTDPNSYCGSCWAIRFIYSVIFMLFEPDVWVMENIK